MRFAMRTIFVLGSLLAAHAWEPAPDYWLRGVGNLQPTRSSGGLPVLNFTDAIRPEVFDQLVREGRPFVVRDLKSHPMRRWDCEFFRENAVLRKVLGRREYADKSSRQPQWMALEDVMDPHSTSKSDKEASPYYVGIKDVGFQDSLDLADDPHYSASWTKEVLAFVQEHTTVPPFMRRANLETLRRTPEFWFVQGGSAGGAKAHVDTHPESTWTLQLCGEKRWRVAPVKPRNAPHVMKLYQDGQIYSRPEHLSWNIFEDVVLYPGDSLFFGPGFIHQTMVEGKTPAASVTWQFNAPLPTIFMRNFMPRIRFTPDLVELWRQIERLVQSARRKSGRQEDHATFLDLDEDGDVSQAEVRAVVDMWRLVQDQARSAVPEKLRRLELGVKHVVEDEQDLLRMPADLQAAIRRWEEKAAMLDESSSQPHSDL